MINNYKTFTNYSMKAMSENLSSLLLVQNGKYVVMDYAMYRKITSPSLSFNR